MMNFVLACGTVLTAAAGLYWLMVLMDRRRDWRGRMIQIVERRGGKWNF